MSRGEFVEIVESTAPNRGTHTGLSLWRIFLCVPLGTGGSMRGAARLVEVPRMTRNLSVDPHEGLTRLGPVSSAPRGWLRDLIAA